MPPSPRMSIGRLSTTMIRARDQKLRVPDAGEEGWRLPWAVSGPSEDGPSRFMAVSGGQRFRRSDRRSVCRPRSAVPPDQIYDI
jgi:hypothetical protein